ncbi:MAG: ATP-binding protein [Oscillospiraceae bacterium]|nr:ATP-binding protein [Oscillospiraceae bacterium]MBQ4316252.1 ATP-binding protein [Oscillospiraceae bacterium]
MIQRKEYLDNLIALKDKQVIKVITGVRRCGKSTLFELYIDHLKQTGIDNSQIISVNLEKLENADLLDYKALYNYITSKLVHDKNNYIFIDEVQKCSGFEKAVDSLFIKKNCDVYITGSNAYLLSGELATLLSGRYIQIDMLPFSFKEYYEATKESGKSKREIFDRYLRYGSFPYVAYLENNEKIINQYIEGIYNTILIKDVATREKINDVSVLENILKTIGSSIGSPISTKKISDTLISSGRKISPNTVEAYLRALTDSYVLYNATRYDIKGRQFLKTLGKYYFVDTGIRNHIISQSARDLGHLLENVVYLELLRRKNRVNIGKLAEKEVDFVAVNMNEVEYYQVSASVLDEKTLERELAPLQEIKDNYHKTLLTLDDIGNGANYEGIKQINIIDWLLG